MLHRQFDEYMQLCGKESRVAVQFDQIPQTPLYHTPFARRPGGTSYAGRGRRSIEGRWRWPRAMVRRVQDGMYSEVWSGFDVEWPLIDGYHVFRSSTRCLLCGVECVYLAQGAM
jgi:hypothetical protein